MEELIQHVMDELKEGLDADNKPIIKYSRSRITEMLSMLQTAKDIQDDLLEEIAKEIK